MCINACVRAFIITARTCCDLDVQVIVGDAMLIPRWTNIGVDETQHSFECLLCHFQWQSPLQSIGMMQSCHNRIGLKIVIVSSSVKSSSWFETSEPLGRLKV